jgi:hypothetical protein
MLVKRLDPASDVHSARDIKGLKQLVCAVDELVKSVPSDAGLDVHFNLQLAIKGIITEPKPPQEQKNAALCFLKIYRQRARNQKLERNKTLMQKICDSYFEDCLKSAPGPERRQSPDRYYWKLYLGLVPHLLACVKGLEGYAFWAEAEAKKGYRGSEKQDVHKMTDGLV